MSGTKPANLSTTSKDFPQELLDQLNYVVSDIYAWISELRGQDGFMHDENSSVQYITAADVTAANLTANGDVGTQSDQVASGDKGVTNGSNHDHVGGDGAAITEAALTFADNTTHNVGPTKHGFTPKTPNDATKFLRGDSTWTKVPNLVDRGDPSGRDFTSLTTDGNWHDLDLSAIVPAGATAVKLYVQVGDDAAGSYLWFRKNGNANEDNGSIVRTQVAGVINEATFDVFCDAARVVEYQGSNVVFDSINISVLGWYI